MTDPCVDPATAIIIACTNALKEAFSPTAPCPPDGGGSTNVRFFAGDGLPTAAWDAQTSGGGDCNEPLLWVRVVRRFRTEQTRAFAQPRLEPAPCGAQRVIVAEIGVARCAILDAQPTWEQYETEATVSLDDSWRLELAMCRITGTLTKVGEYALSTDSVAPYGPEGGVIAWTGVVYVQI